MPILYLLANPFLSLPFSGRMFKNCRGVVNHPKMFGPLPVIVWRKLAQSRAWKHDGLFDHAIWMFHTVHVPKLADGFIPYEV